MIIICCGMYRAASTWQYNVACRLVQQYYGGERLGYFHDGQSLKQRLGPQLDKADNWIVIKAHEPDPFFIELVTAGVALPLYGYRDIRDVAYSVAHKRSSTFECEIEGTDFLAQTVRNFKMWTGLPGVLSQRYEDVIRGPAEGVREIAAFLGLTLSSTEVGEIAAAFSLDNNRQRASQFARELHERGVDLSDPANALQFDEETQLHWNHIRDGSTGGWRQQATPRHLAVLARGCGTWLIELDYEQDWAWALPALPYLLFEEPLAYMSQVNNLEKHLQRHQESMAGLHEHLASERSRAALLIQELQALHAKPRVPTLE